VNTHKNNIFVSLTSYFIYQNDIIRIQNSNNLIKEDKLVLAT